MASPKSAPDDLQGRLDTAQRRHRKCLRKFEDATRVLALRSRKLLATEARIVSIQTTIEGARKAGSIARSPAEPPNAWLIFNPTAGRAAEDNGVRLVKVIEGLHAHGIWPRVHVKTSGKEARAFTCEAVKSGAGLVIVAGGDGTIGDVATELIGTRAVLGLIPIGTMNNLARSLGVPLDIDGACALIAMRTTRHIDAGRVSAGEEPDGVGTVEYFFDCAGVGKLALAAVAGQAFEKRRWGALPRALRALFSAKLATVQVELDGVAMSASTGMVTISNAPIMGNKLLCAPDAKMDDGFFDVAVYDGMGDVALTAHFLAVTEGHTDPVPTYRARHIRIHMADAMPSSADMQVTEKRHVIDVHVLPGAVEMIVGNGIGLTLPVASAPEAPAFAPDPPVVERQGEPNNGQIDQKA